jgi:hypothetical protein
MSHHVAPCCDIARVADRQVLHGDGIHRSIPNLGRPRRGPWERALADASCILVHGL